MPPSSPGVRSLGSRRVAGVRRTQLHDLCIVAPRAGCGRCSTDGVVGVLDIEEREAVVVAGGAGILRAKPRVTHVRVQAHGGARHGPSRCSRCDRCTRRRARSYLPREQHARPRPPRRPVRPCPVTRAGVRRRPARARRWSTRAAVGPRRAPRRHDARGAAGGPRPLLAPAAYVGRRAAAPLRVLAGGSGIATVRPRAAPGRPR